jgi:hypothetical protein
MTTEKFRVLISRLRDDLGPEDTAVVNSAANDPTLRGIMSFADWRFNYTEDPKEPGLTITLRCGRDGP